MSRHAISVVLLGGLLCVQCSSYRPGYPGPAPRPAEDPVAGNASNGPSGQVRPTEGQVVRVTTAAKARTVGTLRAVAGDSLLVFVLDRDAAMAIPLESVRRLEVRQGTKSNFLKGAGIGFVGGFASTLLLGLSDSGGNDDWVMVVATFSGCVGALAGGVVGAFIRTDRWLPAAIPTRPVGARFGPGSGSRLSIGVTLRRRAP